MAKFKTFCFSTFRNQTECFTADTMKKIYELPSFQNTDMFELFEIPLSFDILFFHQKSKVKYTSFVF